MRWVAVLFPLGWFALLALVAAGHTTAAVVEEQRVPGAAEAAAYGGEDPVCRSSTTLGATVPGLEHRAA